MEPRVIELSRGKIVLLILISVVFLAVGAWMLTLSDAQLEGSQRMMGPTLLRIVAGAAVILGAICLVAGVVKLRDRRPGLILSAEGITDNSSGVSAGLIPWADVTGFSIFQHQKTRMLVVLVVDPEKYILRGNAVQRLLHRANTGMVGSPISIAATTLKIDFDELKREVETWHSRHRAS